MCDRTTYTDVGADYFKYLDMALRERHHIHQVKRLGFIMALAPADVT